MKSICFKEPLFHATIEGRKTQTRRVIKHLGNTMHHGQLLCHWYLSGCPEQQDNGQWEWELQTDVDDSASFSLNPPRYKVGDIVYLKEPYAYLGLGNMEPVVVYKFDGKEYEDDGCSGLLSPWKNKLFMPEWAARYFIEITAIRAERLQDISEEDCVKEGIFFNKHTGEWFVPTFKNVFKHPITAYSWLIDKINGKGTWGSNPWVFVYDYELCNK